MTPPGSSNSSEYSHNDLTSVVTANQNEMTLLSQASDSQDPVQVVLKLKLGSTSIQTLEQRMELIAAIQNRIRLLLKDSNQETTVDDMIHQARGHLLDFGDEFADVTEEMMRKDQLEHLNVVVTDSKGTEESLQFSE